MCCNIFTVWMGGYWEIQTGKRELSGSDPAGATELWFGFLEQCNVSHLVLFHPCACWQRNEGSAATNYSVI